MIALGIDPGTARLGFGVVALEGGQLRLIDAGCITTSPSETDAERLRRIHHSLNALLDEHRPERVAIERLYFQRNVRTAMVVGQARGVALLAAGQAGVPCFSYTPQQIKGAVCGSGRADKEQVQRMVGALLSLPAPPEPDHAADALAVALCHANGAPLRAAVAGATA